jgi:hypothetical protein
LVIANRAVNHKKKQVASDREAKTLQKIQDKRKKAEELK